MVLSLIGKVRLTSVIAACVSPYVLAACVPGVGCLDVWALLPDRELYTELMQQVCVRASNVGLAACNRLIARAGTPR